MSPTEGPLVSAPAPPPAVAPPGTAVVIYACLLPGAHTHEGARTESLSTVREYVTACGWVVVDEFVDRVGVEASTPLQRAGLRQALDAVGAGGAAGIAIPAEHMVARSARERRALIEWQRGFPHPPFVISPTSLAGMGLMSQQWQVPARFAQAAAVREWVSACVSDWAPEASDLSLRVNVCVTELFANAVQHAPSGDAVTVRVAPSPTAISVAIEDASLAEPCLREATATEEAGRGLILVAGLSTRWGCTRTSRGKQVWCTFALPPGSGATA
ncbi:ATP-binding protein [Streptomyces sp. 71268]|uniref:ATP-binding protein n=1 Tax=Streptomyces sp. 71268 TaxID=3002640 RepID=UPI0023F78A2F|nr:ATP-binding protein [Streptomyces sp. 71268]WEV29103.1 ATP-binding protein [Streptomyces sp. 71268]